jgi:hypothetical protein
MSAFRLLRPAILIAMMISGSALADPPERNGNVWNGLAHQPTRSVVQEREKASGSAAPQEEKREDEAVDLLARKLLEQQ